MSAIDGKPVMFRDDPVWVGTVLTDAPPLGRPYDMQTVHVQWDQPERFVGCHRIIDLDVIP